MISVKVTNLRQVKNNFKRYKDRLDGDSRIWQVIANQGHGDIMDHFAKEEGPGGSKWTDFGRGKYSTRRSARGGNMLLQDTGRLRGSIRAKGYGSNARIQTGANYAGYHNSGTKRIPKRTFMWISEKAQDLMAKTFARYIVK